MYGLPGKDGLYRVEWRDICAGFVVKRGLLVQCAPILKRHFWLWQFAKWVCP